jgi:hypothetical protein
VALDKGMDAETGERLFQSVLEQRLIFWPLCDQGA